MQLVNIIQARASNYREPFCQADLLLVFLRLGGTILQVPSAILPPNFAAIVATFERASAAIFTCFPFLFVVLAKRQIVDFGKIAL